MNRSFFLSLAVVRTRSKPCDAPSRLCVRSVSTRSAFPSAPASRSTGSATDRSVLFVGFTATMAGSDFSCPFIIGYGSSPPRCGPARREPPGRTRDLPGTDVVCLHVMESATAAGRQRLAWRRRTSCLRRCSTSRPLRLSGFRGSIVHPTQSLCTLRDRRRRRPRNTHYRASATTYPDRTFTG